MRGRVEEHKSSQMLPLTPSSEQTHTHTKCGTTNHKVRTTNLIVNLLDHSLTMSQLSQHYLSIEILQGVH